MKHETLAILGLVATNTKEFMNKKAKKE